MVAGTARSGTTWLAELIASQQPTRIMFEPFDPIHVPDFAPFPQFLYVRPGEHNVELHAFCERLFTGQIRHPRIDKTIDVLRPKARLVKDVRANLLLKWINSQFPDLPLVLILRHPCAVVTSRMELGWATDDDISPMMSQHQLIEDHFQDQVDVIKGARHDEEKHAIIWSMHNAVPLSQFKNGGLTVVKHEDFIADPRSSLKSLCKSIGWTYDDKLDRIYRRPSRTSSRTTALRGGAAANRRWQNSLSSSQIDRVMRVVDAFGLGHLYP